MATSRFSGDAGRDDHPLDRGHLRLPDGAKSRRHFRPGLGPNQPLSGLYGPKWPGHHLALSKSPDLPSAADFERVFSWSSWQIALKEKSLAYCLSGITASVTNTLFVILLSALWYGNNSHQLLVALGKNSGNLLAVLFVALGANCLLESAFSGIVTPVIASAVNKRLARR